MSLHYRGLECKSRKSRNTWSNRQIWPWSTEWSRAKANRVLPREHTGHSKQRLPTTQEKMLHMDVTRCQHWNQINYILCSQRWRSSIHSTKTRPGVQNEAEQRLTKFGQENELVTANTLFQQHKRWLYIGTSQWLIPKSDWLYSL